MVSCSNKIILKNFLLTWNHVRNEKMKLNNFSMNIHEAVVAANSSIFLL